MSTNENKSGRPKKEDNPFNDIFRKLIGTATQQEVADKIGVSRQNVGRWLSGNTAPDINTLSKIADAYNVSTDYLLGRTPNRTANTNLQAVCKYTGLSENAIKEVRSMPCDIKAILDLICSSTDFFAVLICLSKFYNCCEVLSTNNYEPQTHPLTFSPDDEISKKTLGELEIYNSKDIAEFQSTKFFNGLFSYLENKAHDKNKSEKDGDPNG